MNTKLTLVLVAIIVVGLLAFVAWRSPQDDASPAATDEEENMAAEHMSETDSTGNSETATPTTGSASLAYLMGLGQRLTCDVVYEPQSGTSVVSTVYLDGEHMRTDSEMMMAGEVYKSHMIYDGDMMYTWNASSVSQSAVKFRVGDMMDGSGTADDGRSVDLNQKIEYNCRPWSVDASIFVPPADIDFMDMEEMMRNAGQAPQVQ